MHPFGNTRVASTPSASATAAPDEHCHRSPPELRNQFLALEVSPVIGNISTKAKNKAFFDAPSVVIWHHRRQNIDSSILLFRPRRSSERNRFTRDADGTKKRLFSLRQYQLCPALLATSYLPTTQ